VPTPSPTPRPTNMPNPAPTPSPTPSGLPTCKPASAGTCALLDNADKGQVHKQVKVCEAADRFVEWSANSKSTVNPYPDIFIQCKGWASGGWGVARAFEQNHENYHGSGYAKSGIKDCNSADPFVATKASMYMYAKETYTCYFDCVQCAMPPPPTPAPTPYPGTEKLEKYIIDNGGGDNTALIMASMALSFMISLCCCICCGFVAWKKKKQQQQDPVQVNVAVAGNKVRQIV